MESANSVDDQTLVARFSAADLTQEHWTHRAHLRVALHYLQVYSPERALELLRRDIQNLNLFHGVYTTKERGYHETRTRLWLAVLAYGLKSESAETLLERFSRSDVASDYYHSETLKTWQSRIDWVAPDKLALSLDPGSLVPRDP